MHRTTLHKRVLGALATVGVAATIAAPANAASPLPIIGAKLTPKVVAKPRKAVKKPGPIGPPISVAVPSLSTSPVKLPVPPPVPPAAKVPTATSTRPVPLPPATDPLAKLPVPTATGIKPSTSNTPRIPAA